MVQASEAKRPGAYAVSNESKGQPVFYSVQVPTGVAPGSTFIFRAGERNGLLARCPSNAKVRRPTPGRLVSWCCVGP